MSYDELEKFVTAQTTSGRIGTTSGQAMGVTLRRLKANLEPAEADDVRKLDVDGLIHRFANLNSNVGPSSLTSYKSRLVSARKMFLEWRENPTGWKPRTASAPSPRGKANSGAAKKKDTRPESRDLFEPPPALDPPPPGDSLTYPFPLRDGLVVRLVGLPPDLTQADVERIARFLRVLCID